MTDRPLLALAHSADAVGGFVAGYDDIWWPAAGLHTPDRRDVSC
jgi:hypothetical protein